MVPTTDWFVVEVEMHQLSQKPLSPEDWGMNTLAHLGLEAALTDGMGFGEVRPLFR